MKKLFTLLIAAATAFGAYADLDGSGYYRVKNYKTNRYASIIDNRGSIDIIATTADLQAIKLWRVWDDVAHDPASILYISNVSSDDYQLTAQGTGVYQIINHYLKLRANGSADGQTLYMAYGTNGKATRYLGDGNTLNRDRGSMSTNCDGDYRKWFILPVEADGDDYFGAYPDVEASDGLYQALYASFPYSAYSKGVKFYYVSNVSKDVCELTEITGTVPEATPVVVECVGKTASDNRLNVGGTASAISDNKLRGQYFNCDIAGHVNRVAYNPSTMRVLGRCSDGSLGFIKATGLDYIPANTAYLVVPEWYSDEIKCVKSHADFIAGIGDVAAEDADAPNTVYTLTGMQLYKNATAEQIAALPKGIYIIRGKKVALR